MYLICLFSFVDHTATLIHRFIIVLLLRTVIELLRFDFTKVSSKSYQHGLCMFFPWVDMHRGIFISLILTRCCFQFISYYYFIEFELY